MPCKHANGVDGQQRLRTHSDSHFVLYGLVDTQNWVVFHIQPGFVFYFRVCSCHSQVSPHCPSGPYLQFSRQERRDWLSWDLSSERNMRPSSRGAGTNSGAAGLSVQLCLGGCRSWSRLFWLRWYRSSGQILWLELFSFVRQCYWCICSSRCLQNRGQSLNIGFSKWNARRKPCLLLLQ